MNRMLDGFSLWETSIALTIVGLISTVGLGAVKRWREHQQVAITQTHQERILTAIALHSTRVGSFPYPADPQAPMHMTGCSRVPEGSPKDQSGIVPYRTLGLPEVVAKDGYGRYFTYVGGGTGPDICTSEPAFPLTMHQQMQGSVQPLHVDIQDPVVVILISHGANGYGAWEGEEGRLHQKLSGKHGPQERAHAQVHMHAHTSATQSFVIAPVSYDPRTYYDDHVVWITRSHLLAIYAKTICKIPERPFV